ncbi:MAG: mannose-1-phosphate guanylyltransferase [Candidatus Krumholzibacteriia bacterium]|jgi:mannose-1-phosphate guanylyltransferase
MDNLRAIILAAGFGTRLTPVTDHIPKPLLPVVGQPLLDQIIDRVFQAGASKIAINSHHLGGMIGTHVAAHSQTEKLEHFPEAEILGTGGALANAREFLGDSRRFMVHNGDVISDMDLAALLADHNRSGALVTMALVPWPAVNTVLLGVDGAVRHIAGLSEAPEPKEGDRKLTYTGVAVFEASFLENIEAGESSLITPIVEILKESPGLVRGFAPPSLAWDDLGTLSRWLRATEVDANTVDGFGLSRITGHGSDRKFWRLSQGDWSAVAMMSPPEDEEYRRFVTIGSFLHSQELGAAEFLSRADEARTVLMADLGPESLYALTKNESLPVDSLTKKYEAVVDHLLVLQAATESAAELCPSALDRVFGRDQLLFESSYFEKQFLQGHLGLEPELTAPLAPEFNELAKAVDKMPKVLMHRDFQSQNIHLQGDKVRLVDYQGMRRGPFAYDLASLVWDPYVDLPETLRQALVQRFASQTPLVKSDHVAQMSILAGLQRLMQALGAYSYLGHVKGRTKFLDHIPSGLNNLQQLLGQTTSIQLPRLTELVSKLS